MKTIKTIIAALFVLTTAAVAVSGCAAGREAVADKSGAELWGENCQRCHNAPPGGAFTPKEWDAIGMHMQLRANLTQDETQKIIDFLKLTSQ